MLQWFPNMVGKVLEGPHVPCAQLVPRFLRLLEVQPQLCQDLEELSQPLVSLRRVPFLERKVSVLLHQPSPVSQLPLVWIAATCQLLLVQHKRRLGQLLGKLPDERPVERLLDVESPSV